MNVQHTKKVRESLSGEVLARYEERQKDREEKLKKIEEVGTLNAAGMSAAVQRAAHMTPAEGRAMVSEMTVAKGPGKGGKSFEAIIDLDDSDHINFLLRGTRAARAVCRITQNGDPIGTGFLVAPGLILTNNHVIGSQDEASSFVAEFDFELDIDDAQRSPVFRFALDPENLFATSDAETELDFTFVSTKPTSLRDSEPITSFGWLPMDERVNKILEGEPAVIIQHPRGNPKRVCLFSAELVDRLEDFLHYTTDTDGGSSGSPVFNRSWQLIGLHHAATRSDKARRGHQLVVNEGVRISRIIDALRRAKRVKGEKDDIAKILSTITSPEIVADGRPQAPPLVAASAPRGARPARGRRRWTERIDRIELERTKITRLPKDHFAGRDAKHFGYKPGFLGRDKFRIELPGLPRALADDAIRVGNSSDVELKYTHYSVVMSESRRLPYFTAVNINGAESQRLGRKDREFEAADKWYFDPRISEDFQLGPEIYDGTPFDFGHLVRREDPIWGDLNTSRMANDDTFYMTNASPQHSDLNQKTWLALENCVLKAAREGEVKVSVFTGPVLSPQDPTFRDVQVPTAFWKIVAYRDGNQLCAHGFMQFQDSEVDDMIRRESFDAFEAAVEYQVPIKEIARDTGLEFGPLLKADQPLGVSEEAVANGKTKRRRRLSGRIVDSLFERIAGARRVDDDLDDEEDDAPDDTSVVVKHKITPASKSGKHHGNGHDLQKSIVQALKDVLSEFE